MLILSYHKYPHLMMMISTFFIMTSLVLFQIDSAYILEWNVSTINSTSISLPIMIEASSMLFMFTVSFISFNVLLFSKVYMSGEVNLHRFTQMVMLFIMSMMLLILCPNTMMMLIGWDGLGITSFLLVIFYQNSASLKSGFITLTTNRIGDCLILTSIAITMSQGQWNFMNMWNDAISSNLWLMALITLAAMTKSAQFPFMAWLTCAMAAPTPVSALVHSSTLVTAGVFLLIRFHDFLSSFEYFKPSLMTVSVITMLVSAYWAITNKDMKETIALSTMSQLGLMMSALSMGYTNLCFFHLITHAMFKATMFMAAGMVIMFKLHRQNFSNMKLNTYAKTIAFAMGMSIMSMNALFFTSGYYSKDMILETIWYDVAPTIWMSALYMGTAMTAIYSARLWRASMTTRNSTKIFVTKNYWHHLSKSNIMSNKFTIMEMPLILMGLMSMCIGSMSFWMITSQSDSPTTNSMIEWAPIIASLSGVVTAVSYCPTNSQKKITIAMKKMYWKHTLHYHHNNTKKTMASHQEITHHLEFLNKLFMKPFSMLNKMLVNPKVSIVKPAKLMSLNQMSKKTYNRFVKLNYSFATPFLKMSYLIEKTLDMGMYKVFGTSLLTSITPIMSQTTLSVQKSSINEMLLLIMTIIMLITPLLMYDI